MRGLFLLVTFSTLAIYSIFVPLIGLWTWTGITYLAPQNYVWGMGATVRYVYLIVILTVLSSIVHRSAARITQHGPVVLMCALCLWIAVTTALAVDKAYAISQFELTLKVIALFFMTALLVQGRREIDVTVAVIALSVGLFGIKGGIFGILTGGQYLVWGPPNSFLYANNAIALGLVSVIPLFWYLSTIVGKRWLRVGLIVSLSLCFVSVLISYSRGASLALGSMLLYWAVITKRKVAGLVFLAIAGTIAILLMPAEWWMRIESIAEYEADGSALQRLEMWKYAIAVANDRFFGGGFGVFLTYDLYPLYNVNLETVVYRARSAHSIYFEVLGQHGYVGLILFLGFWASVMLGLRRLAREANEAWVSRLATALQLSLVGFAVGGAFLNKAFEWPLSFQVAALALALARYAKVAKVPEGEPQRLWRLGGRRGSGSALRDGAGLRHRVG